MVNAFVFYSKKLKRSLDYTCDDDGTVACGEIHVTPGPWPRTWCDHLEEIMGEGGDSAVIWDKDPDVEYVSFKCLMIPIIPSRGEWEKVELTKVETAPMPTYRVTWEGNFIGFITQGEGRNTIRSMLFEWICSRPKATECGSSSHGLNEEINSRRSPKALERWFLSRHAMCSPCFEKLMASLSAFIPEKESSGVWS